jgi:tetratricopeptide (TPR) repeat protein
MKQLLTIVGFFLLTQTALGQTVQRIRKVVQIMPEQTFYLNGGMRATFGGKSRTFYKIDLPKNTVEWYYTFSTSEGQTPSPSSLNLVPQLTRLVDPSGMTALAASAVMTPTGSNTCDIYLMNRQNADAFLEKVDNLGGKYYYTLSGSRENYRSGTVQVKDATYGTYFLGFKNPSASTGITVAFEVAAVVEEAVVNNDVWAKETKDRFYNTFYQNLKSQKVDDAIAKEIADCLVTKVAAQTNPAAYDAMAQNERDALFNSIYAGCTEQYKEQKTPEQEKATNYGNLGWRSYENGDIDKCIEYSKKALALDNTLGFVKANLGLCYLIKGDETTATDYYIDALSDIKKMKVASQIKTYLQATIDDINVAVKKYPAMKNGSDVKALFQGELQGH